MSDVFPGARLFETLVSILPDEPGIAVIHSSFSSLRPPLAFRPYDAVFAISRLRALGWTIAIPAFTFSFCSQRTFAVLGTPSEVGPFADWIQAGLPEARRSAHPIYSFVALGPKRDDMLTGISSSAFGEDSIFQYFESHDASVIMLGCGWEYCTPFHRYEETAEVPYRYLKIFDGQSCDSRGVRPVHAKMYVRDLDLAPRNDFMPAVDELRRRDLIFGKDLWGGRAERVQFSSLREVCGTQIAENPLVYVRNATEVRARIEEREARARNKPLKIALLGHSNVDFLRNSLTRQMSSLVTDVAVEAFSVPFGQLEREVLSDASDLANFQARYSVFVNRLEDLAGVTSLDEVDCDLVPDLVRAYGDIIRAQADQVGGWIIVFRFAELQPTNLEGGYISSVVDKANNQLAALLATQSQLMWIDPGREAAVNSNAAFDPRLWHLGRFPFSQSLTDRLAARLAGIILAASGRTARLIVLDLDNTLWGGVLGEDGIEGVALGGDYPGNAFRSFQRALKRLSSTGVALAVASKNDTDLALRAMNEHPEMVIREGDLVGHRIGWNSKSEGIISLCEDLGLGLGSVLFVDDNPIEREAVRLNLPAVRILDLPTDPAEYTKALLDSPYLAAGNITEEDLRRVQSYKSKAEIDAKRATNVSMEDFYASLGMTLYFQPLDSGNIARAAQLCVKTNQFNTTTRRYDSTDLKAIVDSGGEVIVLGLSDRVSERENIGLLILKPKKNLSEGVVDLFLLSCRVLGRGIEAATMAWSLRHARMQGWNCLTGLIFETERNTPVREVFAQAGFEKSGHERAWTRSTADAPPLPIWLKVADFTIPALSSKDSRSEAA